MNFKTNLKQNLLMRVRLNMLNNLGIDMFINNNIKRRIILC